MDKHDEAHIWHFLFRSRVYGPPAGGRVPAGGVDRNHVPVRGRAGDRLLGGGESGAAAEEEAGCKAQKTDHGKEKSMTLEEKKRLVNLALEANERGKDAEGNDVEVYCACYGGETGLSIAVRKVNKEDATKLGEDLMSASLYGHTRADSPEYKECEAYLEKLSAKGEKT